MSKYGCFIMRPETRWASLFCLT